MRAFLSYGVMGKSVYKRALHGCIAPWRMTGIRHGGHYVIFFDMFGCASERKMLFGVGVVCI